MKVPNNYVRSKCCRAYQDSSNAACIRCGETFQAEQAVEQPLAPDVFTGCANCVEFEDCPFRDGYCSAWAPRG